MNNESGLRGGMLSFFPLSPCVYTGIRNQYSVLLLRGVGGWRSSDAAVNVIFCSSVFILAECLRIRWSMVNRNRNSSK